jgi:hypothetical protein
VSHRRRALLVLVALVALAGAAGCDPSKGSPCAHKGDVYSKSGRPILHCGSGGTWQ